MPPRQQDAKTKPIISPTQVELYLKCGEAYRRRYINREVIPPRIALIKGTAVHKGAAEHNFKQKLKTHRDLPARKLIDSAVATFDDRVKHDGVMLQPDEKTVGKRKALGQARDSVVRLAGLFAGQVAPKYQPKYVESEQRIELEASPRDLLCKVDLITKPNEILELKTGTKSLNQAKVDGLMQLTFESLTYKALHKQQPKRIILEQMVDLKSPKVLTFKTNRTREDYVALVNTINAAITGIEAGQFKPASPGAWWCSAKWCGYHATCPYVNSSRGIAIIGSEEDG